MIFSVQHNSMAVTAMRNLQQAGFSMGESMEKLSSGFRINAAADGPADLIASEQLRARIEGLEKAIRNVRTAGDVMDIADGALGEVQGIIRNMRALAVGAMNSGIITGEQTAADQAELDAGLSAIERILSTTNYAGEKLLDGLGLDLKYGYGGTMAAGGENPLPAPDAALDAGRIAPPEAANAGLLNVTPTADGNPVRDDAVHAEGAVTDRTAAGKTFDIGKLSESDRALHDLSRKLNGLNMDGLGATELVVGRDENGVEITRSYSLRDLYSGGDASLSSDPRAAMLTLKQAGDDISAMRAGIAANRRYAVEAEENVLYAELEGCTRMESHLRDADFASEMPKFVRSKLVSQVGVRMLSAAMENSRAVVDLMT